MFSGPASCPPTIFLQTPITVTITFHFASAVATLPLPLPVYFYNSLTINIVLLVPLVTGDHSSLNA